MGLEVWITVVVLAAMVGAFASERVAPVVAMGAAVVTLHLLGVITVGQAFGGFSNSAPITVAALYVVAGAAELTGALGGLTDRALGRKGVASTRAAIARVAVPASLGSGVVANTPLVALLAPRVQTWARRHGVAPSTLLMPLSYAAVLGGVITILGTSTNLVVNGLLAETGEEPFGVFSITPVGLPVAVAGIAALVVLGPHLLVRREAPVDTLRTPREYTVEMTVAPGGALSGRRVGEAGLRDLSGVALVDVVRERRPLPAVEQEEELFEGDRLIFAGEVERIIDLQRVSGLVLDPDPGAAEVAAPGRGYCEAVVAGSGPLAGRTLQEVAFRDRHQAAVVAVHRAGEPLSGTLGDIRLRGGDVLLVVADDRFVERSRDLPDFVLVAAVDGATPVRRSGARTVEVAMLALVVVAGSGLVDLTRTALAVALGLIAARVITPSEARRSINLDVILIIGFSFGLGAAADASGLAALAADRLVGVTEAFGPVAVLAGIMLGTLVVTELLSNNAAAALMFPVALATTAQTGVDLHALAVGIMIMASCSFLTPIGYQTNTMVWSMGGYRFLDFTRLGAPLTVVVFAVSLLVIPLAFPL
jgi:di/tricarboxylate transporter